MIATIGFSIKIGAAGCGESSGDRESPNPGLPKAALKLGSATHRKVTRGLEAIVGLSCTPFRFPLSHQPPITHLIPPLHSPLYQFHTHPSTFTHLTRITTLRKTYPPKVVCPRRSRTLSESFFAFPSLFHCTPPMPLAPFITISSIHLLT
jgi:hypothetical protein